MIGTELGNMGISSLGTYDDTELGYTDVNSDGKYEVLLLGASIGYLYGLENGGTEHTELLSSNGRLIVTTLLII